MKIRFMKKKAVDQLKENMETYYTNYKKNTNEWIEDELQYDAFEYYIDVKDFELATLQYGQTGRIVNASEIDLENCKIVYSNLKDISDSQAADERLWAGLCNDAFYDYVRRRRGYTYLIPKDPAKDASRAVSQFFFKKGGGASSRFRNTMARYWWIGRLTYDLVPNGDDHWAGLDKIGSEDFSSKINEIFYNNTFSYNPQILRGIAEGIDYFRQHGRNILVRDHIRPALQELNAVGGGILLDSLSSDEIKKMFVESIGEIINGRDTDVIYQDDIDSDEDDQDEFAEGATEIDVDYQSEIDEREQQDTYIDPSVALGTPEFVTRGVKVTVIMPDGSETQYNIPVDKAERKLYAIEEKMIQEKMKQGQTFKVMGRNYTVKGISYI